jgi:hypothetical protein
MNKKEIDYSVQFSCIKIEGGKIQLYDIVALFLKLPAKSSLKFEIKYDTEVRSHVGVVDGYYIVQTAKTWSGPVKNANFELNFLFPIEMSEIEIYYLNDFINFSGASNITNSGAELNPALKIMKNNLFLGIKYELLNMDPQLDLNISFHNTDRIRNLTIEKETKKYKSIIDTFKIKEKKHL